MRDMYKNLNIQQLKIIEEFHENEMRRLKRICDPLIRRKGVAEMYRDDLYDVASDTLLESVISFKPDRHCSFFTYLTGNINRAFYDWTRDNTTRLCRSNIQTDEKGQIMRDEDGNVIKIHNISLDAPTEDGVDIREKVASDFDIEDEVIGIVGDGNIQEEWHREVIEYLEMLSPMQRKIIILLAENKDKDEICEELHITANHFKNSIKKIMADEKIKPLRTLAEGKN